MLTKQDQLDVKAIEDAVDQIYDLYIKICERHPEPVHPSELGLTEDVEALLDGIFETLLNEYEDEQEENDIDKE